MENASKALIIAGAILLAIVIISLGLIVVNNTRNVTDNTNLSEQEIQAFNAKFTPYQGTKVSGTQIKTLIQTVIASNASNDDKKVTIIYDGSTYDDTTDDKKIEKISVVTGKTYKVTLSYNNALINKITIE